MKALFKLYSNHPVVIQKEGFFKHLNPSFAQMLMATDFNTNHENIIIVLPNLYEAQKYYDALSQMLGSDDVLFYPADQTLTAMMALGSFEFRNERLYTLRQLLKRDKSYVVVTTQQGILQRQLKPKDYINSVFVLEKGKSYVIDNLVKKLLYNGYQRNYTVERPGEFSVRGSIVDIFTHDNTNPYRLDFFGDELEEIKIFDVITQKSFEKTDSLSLAPLSELFFTDEQKHRALERIKNYFSTRNLSEKETQKYQTDLENLEQRKRLEGLILYIPFFNNEETTILNFSHKQKIYVIDRDKMAINEKTTVSDLETYATSMQGETFSKLSLTLPLDYLEDKQIMYLNISPILGLQATDLKVEEMPQYQGLLLPFYNLLNQYEAYTKIFLASDSNRTQIKAALDDHHYKYVEDEILEKSISIIEDAKIQSGFIDHVNQVMVASEADLFTIKTSRKIRYRSVVNQSVKIRDVSELNVGDYVVHYDFGIGQYVGLKTMSLSGEKRDYLHLIYANDEYLYVPVDQIELVLKYRSVQDLAPKLSKLSGKTWANTKAQVKKRIKDMSDRLLKLYALRQEAKGFAYSPDNDMTMQFADDFIYEETKDQQQAIDAVTQDMESSRPMDRLIAGDVGFGKTEVALRAAFKAVLDAKQVAYLVPTTVLARQHYLTFKERFEKYGATVELLSRFVTKAEQDKTVQRIKKGLVDVVIGTHRLLSNDIKFKDLGLFIIDEEQRFGVEHKEKIKEMKVNVDTLTLSATPIPRTLQMAIYGIKDLSMIDTPPLNRYPVQTYVVERQEALIKEAIERELSRGGQIFYLYNKTSDMERLVGKINKIVPQARIAFAHGKMGKDQLEEVLSAFIDRAFDILVATTIIETGVDIPNTNTLIIHDADKLGLAQLYQIRGRVGRSDKIAYAYLMYDPYKDMNDEAKKRLSVIEDFTDLGSGFKIALRDLSIRGAGDILGEEQSGFIDSVGMDLYMKLLDEVITGKEDEPKKPLVAEEIYASRHIPQEYIDNDAVRIEIHKRINYVSSLAQIEDLKVELADRFGSLDVEMVIYMYEKLFKKLSAKMGVEKVTTTSKTVQLTLSHEASEKVLGDHLFAASSISDMKIVLGYMRGKVQITAHTDKQQAHWLYLMCQFLENYFRKIN